MRDAGCNMQGARLLSYTVIVKQPRLLIAKQTLPKAEELLYFNGVFGFYTG
jgi:hypothetical protein